MTYTTLITDYLGRGLIADRPVSPNVAAGGIATYYATDTSVFWVWNGSAWVSFGASTSIWNAGSVSAVGNGLAVTSTTLAVRSGAGLTFSSGTLLADWNGGSVSALGSGLSLTTGTLTAAGLGGTVTKVVSGAGMTAGTITTSGTLNVDWNAGTVSTLGSGLSLTSGTLIATAATVTAGSGVTINSGTVSVANDVTLAGTAGGTLTINPGGGTSDVYVSMPAAGGTVTLNASPTFKNQTTRLHVKQGATVGSVVLNAGFVFPVTQGPTAYAAGVIANDSDMLGLFSPNGTVYRVVAIDQGFTL